MWIIILFYLSMLLPAFSLSQVLVGLYFQNRILWLPFGIVHFSEKQKFKVPTLCIPFIILSVVFLGYTIIGGIVEWNFLMYFGYFLTSVLLVVTIPIIKNKPTIFLRYFKVFFLLNVIYVFWQVVCVNLGLMSLSMIQSNLPAQSEADYFIPFFVCPPFIRYSGLFNESSPFIIYCIICFCFFRSLGKQYAKYKKASFLLILLGGAKIGYLFLLCYSVFFIKSKLIKIITLGLLGSIIILIIVNFDLLMALTNGEVRSILARMNGVEEAGSESLTLWGNGLKTSSNGEVGLDMFSILSSGFGVIGSLLILSCIVGFYKMIRYRKKYIMILPFLLAAMSSGSLLILQYSLLVYCLVYLNYQLPFKDFSEYRLISFSHDYTLYSSS